MTRVSLLLTGNFKQANQGLNSKGFIQTAIRIGKNKTNAGEQNVKSQETAEIKQIILKMNETLHQKER